LFKFISTGALPDRKPRRADLLRVLHGGIDGTSMPAFGLLPEHQLNYLASYVTHLSIRGQVEFDTMLALLSGGKDNLTSSTVENIGIPEYVYQRPGQLLTRWAESNDTKPFEPPAYTDPADEKARAESIRKGHKIFISNQGNCLSCHGDFGRQVT